MYIFRFDLIRKICRWYFLIKVHSERANKSDIPTSVTIYETRSSGIERERETKTIPVAKRKLRSNISLNKVGSMGNRHGTDGAPKFNDEMIAEFCKTSGMTENQVDRE